MDGLKGVVPYSCKPLPKMQLSLFDFDEPPHECPGCASGNNRMHPIPKLTKAFDKYKVFIGKAWGNFSKSYLGGAYADIVVAKPREICTENFIESGCFDDLDSARKHAKYLMTKFARALLFALKNTQDNSKEKWATVPIQNFSECWWDMSIIDIDEQLFKKYDVPQNIRDFVNDNIQQRTEQNIINF